MDTVHVYDVARVVSTLLTLSPQRKTELLRCGEGFLVSWEQTGKSGLCRSSQSLENCLVFIGANLNE
ncbi:Hypothetical predicted protein [Octopus vulgaris]|uniref:Uncharacterized protein n=1 Tax=Octopus vulgaris TaxID=6645 RepID=A0AA36AXN5_OCTVU|nr:Hypothetical predicted protein [Octopus vulgaris]